MYVYSFGGVLGLISAAISAWGIWQGQYLLLCLSQVLAGIYAAFQNPAMVRNDHISIEEPPGYHVIKTPPRVVTGWLLLLMVVATGGTLR